MKASYSNKKPSRTEPLMRKSNRSSQISSLQKTNKKQDGKQDYNTDSDLEKHPIFKEIWPSSGPSSPSDTPTSDKNVPTSIYKFFEVDTEHSSVLAKYVDRFRHGQPQSREERQQKSKEELLPFWWASSPSLPPNLTPEKPDPTLFHHNRAISPSRGSLSVLSDTSQCEHYDSEILQLQERASRLLQKGEVSLEEDSLPVSSDGVGSSDFSSPVSADEPVRKPMISSLPKYNIAKDPSSVMPTPLRPEEDILFQWRLRRKMEKAREWAQSQQHFELQSWQAYSKSKSLHSDQGITGIQEKAPSGLPQETTPQSISGPHLITLDQQTRMATTTATAMPTTMVPSGSVVSSPQALAHVPSHMHLMCDILPCPNQTPKPHEEEMVLHKLDSQIIVVPQKTQNLPLELPITGHVEKDGHLSYTKSTVAPKKHLEKSEKKTSILSKEQKKSARIHSRQKVPTNITSTPQHHQKCTDSKKKSRGDRTPSSPIQSALGQVVSEVLFPSVDSTIVQEIPPLSPHCLVSEQLNDDYKSVEIISQFLKEAEDSDEKEFEDDPLLQVLRKQRKWVKEQINEVDTLLKEF